MIDAAADEQQTAAATTTAAATGPKIALRDISKRFGGVVALDGVSFEVAPGSFHAIVGENGAGKSTLMKVLSGVHAADEGEVIVDGQPQSFVGTRDAEAAGIAIIHQELNLVEELTVAANIFLGRERTGVLGWLKNRQMEAEAADLLGSLEATFTPSDLVGSLRVGDQQLVEIAKALSLDASVLIMDEPTSALTETEVSRLFRVIDQLRAAGTTILYISHKMDEVFGNADAITVIRDGRHIATRPRTELTPDEVVSLMVGRELAAAEASEPRPLGEPVLEVESLHVPWPGHARGYRLDDVSLTVRAGEIVGVAGLMGAGRTELLEAIFGASPERPTGTIRLGGRDVLFTHPAEAKAAGVALVTEDRKRLGLFTQLPVQDNITLCTLGDLAAGGVLRGKTERAAANASIAQLGVKTDGPLAPITSLSGGNQQKCIIARWLRTQPRLLLLDDPTRGVDVGAKAELYRVIRELAGEGLAVLVTSSELPELLQLCDRIAVLCEGRLTGTLDREAFSEEAIMTLATQ